MTIQLMNEEIRLEWTDRLRGRDYIQYTGGALRQQQSDGSYEHCCWGVLCEMAVDAGIIDRTSGSQFRSKKGNCLTFNWYPPAEVLEWAGIDPEAGPSQNIVIYLANHNDNGSNWPLIANEIDVILGGIGA